MIRQRIVVLLVVLLTLTACRPVDSPDDSLPSVEGLPLRQALEAFRRMPDSIQRTEALAGYLRRADSARPDVLSEVVTDAGLLVEPMDHLLLLNAWALVDPAKATDWALRAPEAFRGAAIQSAVFEWARVDPLAAVAKLKLVLGKAEVMRALIPGWFESGQPGLEDFVLGMGYLNSGQRAIYTYVRELIAREGIEAAVAWVESVEGDDALLLALYRQAGSEFAIADAEAGIAWCEKHCAGPHGAALRQFIADRIARTDGARAMEWLKASPDSEGVERMRASRAAFRNWIYSDPSAALAWARSLNEAERVQPWLQPVSVFMAAVVSRSDPQEALAWASNLSDPKEKESALITIGKRWRKIDLAAAEEWLASAPLSDEARDKARANLNPRRPEGS